MLSSGCGRTVFMSERSSPIIRPLARGGNPTGCDNAQRPTPRRFAAKEACAKRSEPEPDFAYVKPSLRGVFMCAVTMALRSFHICGWKLTG